MNPETPQNPREELEVRITALLIGELSAEEASALRTQIATDPELVALHGKLQKTVELLRHATAAAADEPEPARLSKERRERLLAHFKTTPAAPSAKPAVIVRIPRRDWSWVTPMGIAAGVIVLIGGGLFLRTHMVEEAFWESGEGWKESLHGGQPEHHKGGPVVVRQATASGKVQDSVVNLVEGQIRQADDSSRAWTSQPGMINAFGTAASPNLQAYRLYKDGITPVAPATPAPVYQVASIPKELQPLVELSKRGEGTITLNQGPAVPAEPTGSATSFATATMGNALDLNGVNVTSGGLLSATPGLAGSDSAPKAEGAATANDKSRADAMKRLDLAWARPVRKYEKDSANQSAGWTDLNAPVMEPKDGSNGSNWAFQDSDKDSFANEIPFGLNKLGEPKEQNPISMNGGGVIALNGTHTFTGGVTINNGALATTVDSTASAGTISLGSGVAVTTPTAGKPASASNVTTFAGTGGTTQITGGTIQISPAPSEGNTTFSGAISGTAGVEVTAQSDMGRIAQNKPDASERKTTNMELGLDRPAEGEPARDAKADGARGPAELPALEDVQELKRSAGADVESRGGTQRLHLEEKAPAPPPIASPVPGEPVGAARQGGSNRSRIRSEKAADYQPMDDAAARAKKAGKEETLMENVEAKTKADAEDRRQLDESVKTDPARLAKVTAAQRETFKAEEGRLKELQKRVEDETARKLAEAGTPQPEVATTANPFSTFSLNVSDVSFKLAAASLEQGHMPDPTTVRSEEFVNAFDYRDPEPAPGAPLAFAAERAHYPFAQNRDVLRFSVKTAAAGRQPGHPLNIVLLLDKSGSMERADRVNIVREALRVLTAELQPQDRLSVVTFARTPRLWADGLAGDKAAETISRVSDITPEGGTNLEAALDLGYQTALRHLKPGSVNRVVLFTDGAANLGDVDPEALKKKVETNQKKGVDLDCFGIGWEGYNDDLLEQLTRDGDGRYGFINTPEEAAANFATQLAGAFRVAASDVKVQVEFNPSRVTAYRQIGYAKHQLTKEQFRDNSVKAAQIGAAESGNALYVVEVNPHGEGDLATVRVRFRVPGTSDYREHEWPVPYEGTGQDLRQASPALRLAATAAAFSEMLAGNPYAAEVTDQRLLSLINGIPAVYGADPRPQKLEWMIRQAMSLSGH